MAFDGKQQDLLGIGIIKRGGDQNRPGNQPGAKTIMDMQKNAAAAGGAGVSQQHLNNILKRMFNNNDASRMGSSEFGD
jgi:hypothetical protein